MKWLKGKRRRRRRKRSIPASWFAVARVARTLTAPVVTRCFVAAALIAGVVTGVGRLEAYLRQRPEFQAPPDIHLADVPEALQDQIMAVLAPLAEEPWADRDLCRRIGEALEGSAWVQRVHRVRRFSGGTIVVSCDYRTPAALVQSDGDYYLVAHDTVRLPGRYTYHPALVVVQGNVAPPPAPGRRWPGDDLHAALDIINLLGDLPFYNQITGVLVGNYHGRRDARRPHILLATAPSGNRIVWGSAPGENIEENTAQEKIQILKENYRRFGRIDAGFEWIDISVYPDRFTTTPAPR